MKKKYEKPQILIEDYKLSEICASSPCESRVNFQNGNICHSDISFDGFDEYDQPITTYLFNSANQDCRHGHMDNKGEYNGICYHGPTDANNFFTS